MVQLAAAGSLGGQLKVPLEPDLIAGILAHWVSLMLICKIENSFVDLGSDDWFEAV